MKQHWRFWTFITILVLAGVVLIPAFMQEHQKEADLQNATDQYTQLQITTP